MKNFGFTLLEILMVLAIVSILSAVAIPSYHHFQIRAKRQQGKIALLTLVNDMANYYGQHHTYRGASLAFFDFENLTPYQLQIEIIDDDNYQLTALAEFNDPECGDLQINSKGQKQISGTGSVQQCW